MATAAGALLLTGVSASHLPGISNRLRDAEFVSAGDAIRTAIASYWWRTAESGTPHLPASLAELGSNALPADPWTGRADWGTVQRADGGIVGVFSRSGHPVDDGDALAAVAVPRPALSDASRSALGVSAWMFAWQPPVIAPTDRPVDMPRAVDALHGRWPGQTLADARETRVGRGRLVLDSTALSASAGVVPPTAPPGTPPPPVARSQPVRPLLADGAAARPPFAAVPPPAQFLPAAAAEPDARDAAADSDVEPEPAPYVFSSDPHVRRCEIGLGIAQAAQGACRDAHQLRAQDAGIAWDDCMRNLELSVAQCASQR